MPENLNTHAQSSTLPKTRIKDFVQAIDFITPHSSVDRNHICRCVKKAYSLVYILTSSNTQVKFPFYQNKNEHQGFCSGHPILSTPHSLLIEIIYLQVRQKAYRLVYILTSSMLKWSSIFTKIKTRIRDFVQFIQFHQLRIQLLIGIIYAQVRQTIISSIFPFQHFLISRFRFKRNSKN